MKKNYVLLFFMFYLFFDYGYGQLQIKGAATLTIASGSTVVVNDIVNNGGTITNNGTLDIKGNIENNTSDLLSSASSGIVKFSGTAAQQITGNHDVAFYGTLDINNSNGVSITNTSTGADQTIYGTLNFTQGNLTLNSFNLTIGTTDPTNAGSSTGYIKTNGTGVVKRTVGSSNVIFPVGNSAFNPITLNNSGTSDIYSVKVVDNEPANSSTSHMVNRSWVVGEATAGGSNLTVTAQWNASEELASFDRTLSAIGLTNDAGSTYSWSNTTAAVGSDPYTQSATFSNVGTFAVGDYYYSGLRVALKVYLAGAYNATSGNMDKTLNTSSLIPLTDPYGISKTVAAIPTNAVDWVKVELRDKTTNTTVVGTYAAFVDQSGNVIEEDGGNLKITGAAKDNYYIAVLHRNHLGIMSSNTVNIGAATPSYNFTDALSKAWKDSGITSNGAMTEVATGVWAMWAGDANNDGQIQYASGASSDQVTVLSAVGVSTPGGIIKPTYDKCDVNLDGEIQYASGTNSDQISILSSVGVTTPGNIFKAHLP
jgi:hypothetical protein